MESLLRTVCLDRDFPDGFRPAALESRERREGFLAAAGAHAVLGTALVKLERCGVTSNLSSPARRDLQHQLSRHRLRTSVWLAERHRLLRSLAEEGIAPVVLKGAALCSSVYREPAERQFGDIDLLLESREVAPATELLSGMGYEPLGGEEGVEAYQAHHYHVRLEHPRGFVVELHWDLTRPDSAFRLDADAFRSRAGTLDSSDVALRMPSPEDHVPLIVVQQLQGGFRGLRRLVDIDRIVRASTDMDWSYVARAAAAGGLETGTGLALELARRILETPVEHGVRERLRSGPMTRAHLKVLRSPAALLSSHRTGPSPVESRLVRLWLRDGTGAKLEYLRSIASARTDPIGWLWTDTLEAQRSTKGRLRGLAEAAHLLLRQLGLTGSVALRAFPGAANGWDD